MSTGMKALEIVAATTGLKAIETDSTVRVVTIKDLMMKGRAGTSKGMLLERKDWNNKKMGRELVVETVYLSLCKHRWTWKNAKRGDSP